MTIIDDYTVTVDTFAELKTILEGLNYYNLIYLTKDITMTSGISILASKSAITIDGLYPLDGTGTIHTLTDYTSSGTSGTIGVQNASSITMTARNLNIIGNNYYGIFFVPESSSYTGVTVVFENVTYTGPQITYNPNGTTKYIDCTIASSTGTSSVNEIGEVYAVEIGGTTTITQTSTSYPVFWFRGSTSTPSLTILPDADVTINAGYDVMMTSNPVTLDIRENASLTVNSARGICRSSSYRFAAVTVGAGAALRAIQTTANGSYSSIYCDNAFTVNENATVYMQAAYTSAYPLIRFNYATGSLNLNNPASFVLYSSSSNVLYFAAATPVAIQAGQVNYWAAATAITTAGGFDDIPLYSYRKSDQSLLNLTASATTSFTTISTSNLTDEEIAKLPLLTLLQFQTARVLAVGQLALNVHKISEISEAIKGTATPNAGVRVNYTSGGVETSGTVTAAADGAFHVDLDGPIALDTEVTITANLPFLLAKAIMTVLSPGELILKTVPDKITFSMNPIGTQPVLLGRENDEIAIEVTDSRIESGEWYLYVSISSPLTSTSNEEHILEHALVFADEDGAFSTLGSEPLLIYTGADNGGETQTVEITWDFDKGILIRPGETPFYSGETYEAGLIWDLSTETK